MKRRRFLTILGATGASGLVACREEVADGALPWNWRGILFGAECSITLCAEGAARSRELAQACATEMRRLESIFTLFDPESPVSRLNRDGVLKRPPAELVTLMQEAQRLHRLTDGLFDMTVQPLWRFLDSLKEGEAPTEKALEKLRPLIGSEKVQVTQDEISFALPGMGVTLNGIAQGFVTDRIAAFLKENGVSHTLINLGEYSAIGNHPDQRAWEIGLRNPSSPSQIIASEALADGEALAVSGGYGYVFNAGHRWHHLLHPTQLTSPQPAERSVFVRAPSATLADALSTACGVLDKESAQKLAKRASVVVGIVQS